MRIPFPKNPDRNCDGSRGGEAQKLVSANDEVEGLAKAPGKRSRKGTGDLSPRTRWHQLMAYMAQILDGVQRNLDRYGEEMPDSTVQPRLPLI